MRIDHWVFFVSLHTYVFFLIHTIFFLRCRYAGIDVSGPFLEEAYKNLMQYVDGLQHEDMDMVQADYMEGLKIVREHYPHENVCILWLGSSVGNLSASAAVQFSVMLLLLLVLTAKYSCAQVNGYMLHFILLILHPEKLLDFFSSFWGSFFW